MSTTLLIGELRTGKITGSVRALGADWQEILNGSGSIDGVRVHEHVVRRLNLRQTAAAARCFLAVEQDDRIREAGPIWAHDWDDERGVLILGAGSLWSLFDHRYVVPVLEAAQRVQDAVTVVSGVSYGGIARALVAQAMEHVGGDLPLVHAPADTTGDHSEVFPGWKLLKTGQQLRELTTRETGAPDIRFAPRRNPDDRTRLQWLMETGTEEQPQLAQVGADWVFDKTTRKSPVLNVSVKQDATVMGMRGWETGNGSEKGLLVATHTDPTLIDEQGYPLLEIEEARSSVEEQATLDGHVRNLVQRAARPAELIRVKVHATAAREVRAGHYCRLKIRGHAYLPDGERRMRIRSVGGNLSDVVTLEMYPTAATL